MAAFITRTLDQSLKRGSRRAALGQWWRPTLSGALRPIELANTPVRIVCDGTDLWVTVPASDAVVRIEASSGRVEQTWTGFAPATPSSIIAFDGTYLWTANLGSGFPGTPDITRIRVSDAVDTTFSLGLSAPRSILWDGAALWVLDIGDEMLKEVNPATGEVISAMSVLEDPTDMIFDGANLWISNFAANL